jgi:hypothetical protein
MRTFVGFILLALACGAAGCGNGDKPTTSGGQGQQYPDHKPREVPSIVEGGGQPGQLGGAGGTKVGGGGGGGKLPVIEIKQ